MDTIYHIDNDTKLFQGRAAMLKRFYFISIWVVCDCGIEMSVGVYGYLDAFVQRCF